MLLSSSSSLFIALPLVATPRTMGVNYSGPVKQSKGGHCGRRGGNDDHGFDWTGFRFVCSCLRQSQATAHAFEQWHPCFVFSLVLPSFGSACVLPSIRPCQNKSQNTGVACVCPSICTLCFFALFACLFFLSFAPFSSPSMQPPSPPPFFLVFPFYPDIGKLCSFSCG